MYPVAYELQLPPAAKLHPIFHVSLLRPAKGAVPDATPPPLPINEDWELSVTREKILTHRWTTQGRTQTLEVLMKWQHRPVEEASWEEYDLISEQFPTFPLEDK